jgi:phage terminase Nu1 subunit (DNA packaging protein)
MLTVNVAKVAQFLNVTPRRIQQLVKEGMPRGVRGQYDPIKCGAWYVRYLQSAIEKKTVPSGDGGYITLKEERTRLLRAKAELKQIEVAKRRGLLVSIAELEREMTDLVLTTKARILAIPARVSGDLVGETSRVMIQERLEKAAEEALEPLTRRARVLPRGGRTAGDGDPAIRPATRLF